MTGARASVTRVSAKMLNLGMVGKHETNGSFTVMFSETFHSCGLIKIPLLHKAHVNAELALTRLFSG